MVAHLLLPTKRSRTELTSPAIWGKPASWSSKKVTQKASTDRQKYRERQKYNRPKLRQTDMTNNRADINVDILTVINEDIPSEVIYKHIDK